MAVFGLLNMSTTGRRTRVGPADAGTMILVNYLAGRGPFGIGLYAVLASATC